MNTYDKSTVSIEHTGIANNENKVFNLDKENKNNFSPAIHLLRKEKSAENVDILTCSIIHDIINSDNKRDMDRKVGTNLLIRSLERELYKTFKIFKELSRLSLMNLSIQPVIDNNDFSLSISLSFPPTVNNIKTPDNSVLSSLIFGWIMDNNINTICPIVIINSETFIISNNNLIK